METKINKRRDNGEHDIIITVDPGTTVSFEGGWHEIDEEGKILAIWSYLHPTYNYRETWVKMTNREMERVNRAYCGMSSCQCGSGLGRLDEVAGEPGNWWVLHESDEVREIVDEQLGMESQAY